MSRLRISLRRPPSIVVIVLSSGYVYNLSWSSSLEISALIACFSDPVLERESSTRSIWFWSFSRSYMRPTSSVRLSGRCMACFPVSNICLLGLLSVLLPPPYRRKFDTKFCISRMPVYAWISFIDFSFLSSDSNVAVPFKFRLFDAKSLTVGCLITTVRCDLFFLNVFMSFWV